MKGKNKYGQYFTIDSIAQFMVSLINHNKDSKVLEPSCGKGVFLHSLTQAGFSNIDAYEIDRTLGNPYSFVRYESFISSPMDSYDVVIGNPPYIRWKNLEPELKEELNSSALWNKYFNSLCDYMFIFILKSIEQLNNDGELIFICTEYWMNTTNSETLRDYMAQHGYISEIYHFKEASLFEGVCASFVIFKYIKSNTKRETLDFYRYIDERKINYESLVSKSCFKLISIPQFESGHRWLLATSEQQNLLSSFEQHCSVGANDLFSTKAMNRIGDFCDIGNGMVSGLDKAFNITKLNNLSKKEEDASIKVLKAKDLGHYIHVTESRYFFLQERISETEFCKEYPNISAYISEYKDQLNERYNYGKDTQYWEFIFPRNLNLFSRKGKKIFVPCKERISNKNHFRFVLVNDGYFPLQDVTAIVPKYNCQESIEYITAFLNNRRVFEWLGFNGIVKGYIVEFSEAPIASIPYRVIDWNNSKEIAIHDEITQSVRNFIMTHDEKYLATINNCFNTLFLSPSITIPRPSKPSYMNSKRG